MISFWQSTRRMEKALIVSLSRSVLWPPVLIAVLPIFFGSDVIWLCHSISEALTACTAFILLKTIQRKEKMNTKKELSA